MNEPHLFVCSICGEPSKDICVYCAKDACVNHRCARCKRCSDCCLCEVPLDAGAAAHDTRTAVSQPAQPRS